MNKITKNQALVLLELLAQEIKNYSSENYTYTGKAAIHRYRIALNQLLIKSLPK